MRQTQISTTLREPSCAHVMRHKAHITLVAYQLFQRTCVVLSNTCRCRFRTLQRYERKCLISKHFRDFFSAKIFCKQKIFRGHGRVKMGMAM